MTHSRCYHQLGAFASYPRSSELLGRRSITREPRPFAPGSRPFAPRRGRAFPSGRSWGHPRQDPGVGRRPSSALPWKILWGRPADTGSPGPESSVAVALKLEVVGLGQRQPLPVPGAAPGASCPRSVSSEGGLRLLARLPPGATECGGATQSGWAPTRTWATRGPSAGQDPPGSWPPAATAAAAAPAPATAPVQ